MYQIRQLVRSLIPWNINIQKYRSLSEYLEIRLINCDTDSTALKNFALNKFPTEIIKSTHKSRCRVIAVNGFNGMRHWLSAINIAYEYSRIILSKYIILACRRFCRGVKCCIIFQYFWHFYAVIWGELSRVVRSFSDKATPAAVAAGNLLLNRKLSFYSSHRFAVDSEKYKPVNEVKGI